MDAATVNVRSNMKSIAAPERPRPIGRAARAPYISHAAPLGATVSADGVNFSVYAKHATGLDLLLFDAADDRRPSRVISIDPTTNRDYHYWHMFVPRLSAGQIYGFRVF